MSIDWYPVFYAAVLLVWLTATPADRSAARILAVATVSSWLITRGVTVHIAGAWKLAIPGAVETLTLVALLLWARGRAAAVNAFAVGAAWLTHLLCYVDCVGGTNLVYDAYEGLLAGVSVVQLAAFHDTYRHLFCRIRGGLVADRSAALRPPGDRHSVLRGVRAVRVC